MTAPAPRSHFRAPLSQGFSLIELMIASTLGLLLLTAIGALFLSTSRNYRENELIAGMQDQARFALSTLSRDFAMAGYWGGMMGSSAIVPNFADADVDNDSSRATAALLPASDCGPSGSAQAWSFFLSRAIEFRNHDDDTPIGSRWRCIGHHRAGTDAFALRNVSGRATGEMASGEAEVLLRPYHFYLQTNGTVGTLTRWGGSGLASPDPLEAPDFAPMNFHRYVPRIYFIRDYSITPGDGIPALCRKVLCPSGFVAGDDPESSSCGGGSASALGYVSECIAEGVEDMQITWGIDDPNDSDTLADHYDPDPEDPGDPGYLDNARIARIELLVRSRQANPRYQDVKTYSIGDKPSFDPGAVTDPEGTPANAQTERYYRRVYSTTVRLRNLGIQAGEGIQ